MAIQSKILTRQVNADIKDASGTVVQTVTSGVGTLALGKPGDIINRSYGPVVHTGTVTADTEFGTCVEKTGILVNSNDCYGVGLKFDTVKTLSKDQVGSFLVSGACVIKKSQLAGVTSYMNIQSTYIGDSFPSADWKKVVTWAANTAYANGDYVQNDGTYYKCTTATDGDETFPTSKFTALTGTPSVWSETSAYAADTLVKASDAATDIYANPVALDDVMEVEVNGFVAA